MLITAAPVVRGEGEVIGVVATGTPLDALMREIKSNVLADLIIYDLEGNVAATTFTLFDSEEQTLDTPSDVLQSAIQANYESVPLRSVTVNRREYQVAYTPLSIRSQTLGVLGVAWPASAVTSDISTNRIGLSIIFAVFASLVVVVGYVVAQQLSQPIRYLARSAEMVRAGDLSHRSDVRTADEIGILGRAFDEMAARLQTQTEALQLAFKDQEQEAARLATILSSIADGIIVLNTDDTVTHYNPVAEELISRNEEEWMDVLGKISRMAYRENYVQRRVQIDQQWFDVTASPIITAAEKEVGISITLHDVSSQVMNERIRTAFILQMSHELFTPLTAFKGYAELAAMSVDEEPQKTYITKAMDSAGVLNRLITQMLEVAQMLREEFKVQYELTDVGETIKETLEAFSHLFKIKGISLTADIDAGEHYIGVDHLRWMLEHLIRNAVFYTPTGGHVAVSAIEIHDEIIIKVRDTGVGISEKDQPYIFDLFYRGRPTMQDGTEIDVRGTGLGLFVVHNIVRQYGGSVRFTTEKHKGTEFVVRFPIQQDLLDTISDKNILSESAKQEIL